MGSTNPGVGVLASDQKRDGYGTSCLTPVNSGDLRDLLSLVRQPAMQADAEILSHFLGSQAPYKGPTPTGEPVVALECLPKARSPAFSCCDSLPVWARNLEAGKELRELHGNGWARPPEP